MEMIGKVVAYNPQRGFGYVLAANGRKYFAHIRNWESVQGPRVGQEVMFEIGPGITPGRPTQAVNIRLRTEIEVGADALKAGV
jgi:cold shock CspA family protein